MSPEIIAVIAVGLFAVYAVVCAVRYFILKKRFNASRLLIAGLVMLLLVFGTKVYSENMTVFNGAKSIYSYADDFLRDTDTGILSWNDQEQWEAKRVEFSYYYLTVMNSAAIYNEDMEVFLIFCNRLSGLSWDAECREEIVERFINEPIEWSDSGLEINKPVYRELIDTMDRELRFVM